MSVMMLRIRVIAAVVFMLSTLERGDAVVFLLATENAAAERVFAQVVTLYAAAVHRVRFGRGGSRFVVVVVVVVARFPGPSASVSVQRLRAAKQAAVLLLLIVRPNATVVTPVGVVFVVVIFAAAVVVFLRRVLVVVLVVPVTTTIRDRRGFRFFPVVFLAVAAAAGLVRPTAREFAHQPPERLAERFLTLLLLLLLFVAAAADGPRIRRSGRVRREPRLLVHLLRTAAARRRPVAGPAFRFRRIVRFRFRSHRCRRSVRRSPATVPRPVRVRRLCLGPPVRRRRVGRRLEEKNNVLFVFVELPFGSNFICLNVSTGRA